MMEREPLVPVENVEDRVPHSHRINENRSLDRKGLRSFFACIFGLELSIKFGATLLELPTLRLVERMVCAQQLGSDHGVGSEERCKIPVVQNKVAFIMGYKTTLDALPCLLTVLLYGSISNFWGRKFVIMLQISGRFLALAWIVIVGFLSDNAAAELLWIASLFLFIGGGRKAEVSIVYTSFCDIVAEEQRTRLLALAHAAEGLAGILSYPIGSLLMTWRLEAPFALAILVIMLEYFILRHTPETSPYLTGNGGVYVAQAVTQPHWSSISRLWSESILGPIKRASPWNYFNHRGLSIIFFCFFIKRIAFAGENMVSQYISEILHRQISETFWFQTFIHLGMLLTLSVLIPSLTRNVRSPAKELWVIRGSLFNVILGFLIFWTAGSIPIICLGLLACGLGEGLDVGLQSLGSYIVGEKHYGTFFPLSSTLGVTGELLGGPLMAKAYAVRDSNGLPLGYCFVLSAVLFSCLVLVVPLINTRRFPQ